MTELELSFSIVTPLFMGGANSSLAEFRLASFKGAMRFWYRAIAGDYQQHEADIFGDAGAKQGKSPFYLRLHPIKWDTGTWKKNHKNFTRFNNNVGTKRRNGILYLAYPFDSFKRGEHIQRCYIKPVTTFKICLLFPGPVNQLTRQAISAALWLLGHVGGLGSRARRGFGTVQLINWQITQGETWPELEALPIANQADTPGQWCRDLEMGIKTLKSWFPSHEQLTHTIIDNNSRFILINHPSSDWITATNCAGSLMQDFRARKNPDYNEVKCHFLCQGAHHANKQDNIPLQPAKLVRAPERVSFGLPLTFRYSSLSKGKFDRLTFQGKNGSQEKITRSASPLWIRILKIKNNYYPLFSFLAAPLLPANERIHTKEDESLQLPLPSAGDNLLHRFQQNLITNNRCLVFPAVKKQAISPRR